MWAKKIAERYLSPSERLSEIILGLTLVLTVTSTVELGLGEIETGVAVMMVAAIGCNAAWGVVDGVMYVLLSVMERRGIVRLVRSVKAATSEQQAFDYVANELELTVLGKLSESARRRVSADVTTAISELNPIDRRLCEGIFWEPSLASSSSSPPPSPY